MIDENIIPRKSIFKPEEVCEILSIKPYILRFWETEFVEISPIVSSSGKKLFEKKDILLLSVIKGLLFDKKLTLEKAKHEIIKVDVDNLISNAGSENIIKSSESIEESKVKSSPDLEENGNKYFGQLDVNPKYLNEIQDILFEISKKSSLIKQAYQWN